MSAIFGLTAYVLAIYDSQLVKLECGHARSNLPAFFFADSFQSAPTSASYNENKAQLPPATASFAAGLDVEVI
jgi:hypothetical protein